MLVHQPVEQAHAPARAPAGDGWLLLAVLPGHAGDIQMRPGRALLDEALRNCAAVMEPELAPPIFFMSAILERIILS